MTRISFAAILPAIQSAIQVSGNGDGARIKLEVPGSDVLQALRLLGLTGKVFTVTVEAPEE